MIRASYKLYLVIFGIVKVMDGFGKINLGEHIKDTKQFQEVGGVMKAYAISSLVTIGYGVLLLMMIMGVIKDSGSGIEGLQLGYSVAPIFLMIFLSIILKVLFINGKIVLKE